MDDASRPVLYIYNAYYQGLEEYGPTSSWELTWKTSVQSYFGDSVYFFNPDKYGPGSSAECDLALLKLVDALAPKLVMMIYHNGAKWSREFISIGALEKIYSATKVVSIWGDIHHPDQRILIRKIAPFVHLNLCTASSAAVARLNMGDKARYIPVPVLDSKVENSCKCVSKVSFAGGIKDKREKTINFLKKNGVLIHHGGGEGSKSLSRSEFLSLIGHKMSISFGGSKLVSLTNARTFEVLTQESLLLEEWGTETCKLLEPFVDYVPWFTKRDLLRKIDFYQRNPSRAQQIAISGSIKLKTFSNNSLWSSVIEQTLNNETLREIHGVNMNLHGIPLYYRNQAKLLDFLACNPKLDLAYVFLFRIKAKFQTWRLYFKFARRKVKRIILG